MKNEKDLKDCESVAEKLVEKCYERLPRKIFFIHAKKSSQLDTAGIDFLVQFRHYPFSVAIQIKTSGTAETLGVLLPLSDNFTPISRKEIVKKVLRKMGRQYSKHPRIDCMIFVGRPGAIMNNGRLKKEEAVLYDILQATREIFKAIEKRVLKKSKDS